RLTAGPDAEQHALAAIGALVALDDELAVLVLHSLDGFFGAQVHIDLLEDAVPLDDRLLFGRVPDGQKADAADVVRLGHDLFALGIAGDGRGDERVFFDDHVRKLPLNAR